VARCAPGGYTGGTGKVAHARAHQGGLPAPMVAHGVKGGTSPPACRNRWAMPASCWSRGSAVRMACHYARGVAHEGKGGALCCLISRVPEADSPSHRHVLLPWRESLPSSAASSGHHCQRLSSWCVSHARTVCSTVVR